MTGDYPYLVENGNQYSEAPTPSPSPNFGGGALISLRFLLPLPREGDKGGGDLWVITNSDQVDE